MTGAMSTKHIPMVKGDYYEMESDMNQLYLTRGLPGAKYGKAIHPNWKDQESYRDLNIDLILYRYPKADSAGKDRAKKTIAALEDNTYWDTGNKYDS